MNQETIDISLTDLIRLDSELSVIQDHYKDLLFPEGADAPVLDDWNITTHSYRDELQNALRTVIHKRALIDDMKRVLRISKKHFLKVNKDLAIYIGTMPDIYGGQP